MLVIFKIYMHTYIRIHKYTHSRQWSGKCKLSDDDDDDENEKRGKHTHTHIYIYIYTQKKFKPYTILFG
jgi:hypothetical protein